MYIRWLHYDVLEFMTCAAASLFLVPFLSHGRVLGLSTVCRACSVLATAAAATLAE